MSPASRDRIVLFLLRLGGCLMLLAFLAVPLPWSWMDASHRLLGLGPLPEGAIVEYLARSISLLYGVHGGLLLVFSTDIRRYAPAIRFFGAMDMVFGAAVLAIDLEAGMPLFWTLNEGPPVAIVGAVLFALAPRDEGAHWTPAK